MRCQLNASPYYVNALQDDVFSQSLSIVKPLRLVTRPFESKPFKSKQVNDSCKVHLGLFITDFANKRLINVKPPLLFLFNYETI